MLQTLIAALLPSGGQLRARRNAWASMSDCTQRARARAQAEAAMAVAVERCAAGGARAAR